jgi:hypothetical protein
MQYRLISEHPEDLTDGRVVGPGEFVDLDEDQLRETRTEELIAQGKLIPTEDEAQREAKLAERRVKTRQNKEEEE